MKHVTNITRFVLAGSYSKRMGKDIVVFKGQQLGQHSIDSLNPICNSIIIIGNNENYLISVSGFTGNKIKECRSPAGICNALSMSGTSKYIIKDRKHTV